MKQPKLLKSYLEEGRRYFALSVKDLLEARDNYHVFLTRKTNVIGTAIGKARIRKPGVPKSVEKTLENSEVQPYSWPCVLVFVKEWLFQPDLAKGSKLHKELLPERLYLSDGREIPVCVVKAAWQPRSTEKPTPSMKFPGNIIGGGYPIMTKVQGVEHWATLGCLVTDGRMTYGLTSAHVTGRPAESLFTLKNGNEVEIGVSSEKQLRKEDFSSMYPEFPGRHSILNLDLGLIEFHDLTGVSSQIFGLREVTGLADVNHDTLCLGLIGCRVEGYGCASGEMKGEIVGLFYRYASKGGYDFVADYLVGPRHEANAKQVRAFAPAYGDSGTLLVIDAPGSKEDRKALGVLWGGQRDETGKCEQPYGLVSNLGTICQKLDVELVHDWNVGYDRYFGAYAHFVLPSLCPDVIRACLKKHATGNIMRGGGVECESLPSGSTIPHWLRCARSHAPDGDGA